jgi:hypothetical protein
VNQQLEESERLIADFAERNTELEEELRVLMSQVQEKEGEAKVGIVDKDDIKLRWREGKKAPCVMYRYCDAVTDNGTMYCRYDSNDKVYAYHMSSSTWSSTPAIPYKGFALAVIDGLPTTVGGFLPTSGKNTNKLCTLAGKGSGRRWTQMFLPMPTKRYCVSVLCTGAALIAAGGYGPGNMDEVLETVEVLNTETQTWHTAADLPRPLAHSSLTLCGDLVYLLGGVNKDIRFIKSVYSCSLASLLLSTASLAIGGHQYLVHTLTQSSPWKRVARLPVNHSTAVNLHGRLLAIGGRDSKDKSRTAVLMYQPTTNSWEVISHMITPRSGCLSAVLPDNQLMVVGGYTIGGKICDSVEFGTVL